jgi:hypothetical protein
MDYSVPLHALAKSEAQGMLDNFLIIASRASEETLLEAKRAGLEISFATSTIAPLMEWALRELKTVPKAVDDAVPDWIAATDSYHRGLFDFDEPSHRVVLRLAFYVGECFVRNYHGLTWSTGNVETVIANMPVVSGFNHGIEMPPVLVITNLFHRILSGAAKSDCFEVAVQAWCAQTPKPES